MRTPFLYVPADTDPTLFVVLSRMSYYIKAMEESLVRAGIAGFREVEKLAMRNEALAAMDQINEKMDFVKQQIAEQWDPDKKVELQAQWDTSEEKAMLTQALQGYKEQLAEALGDEIF